MENQNTQVEISKIDVLCKLYRSVVTIANDLRQVRYSMVRDCAVKEALEITGVEIADHEFECVVMAAYQRGDIGLKRKGRGLLITKVGHE